jgi:hypothetical protein
MTTTSDLITDCNYSAPKTVAPQRPFGLCSLTCTFECPQTQTSIVPLKKVRPRCETCAVRWQSREKSLRGNWPNKGQRCRQCKRAWQSTAATAGHRPPVMALAQGKGRKAYGRPASSPPVGNWAMQAIPSTLWRPLHIAKRTSRLLVRIGRHQWRIPRPRGMKRGRGAIARRCGWSSRRIALKSH